MLCILLRFFNSCLETVRFFARFLHFPLQLPMILFVSHQVALDLRLFQLGYHSDRSPHE